MRLLLLLVGVARLLGVLLLLEGVLLPLLRFLRKGVELIASKRASTGLDLRTRVDLRGVGIVKALYSVASSRYFFAKDGLQVTMATTVVCSRRRK